MKAAAMARRSLVLLALAGLALTAYLTYDYFGGPAICLGSGCEAVAQSPYSRVFGLPVAVLGLLFYCAVLALGLWDLKATPPLRDHLELTVFGLALTATVFSAYLAYLQFAVIRSLCVLCLASAGLTTTIFILSLLHLFPLRI